MPKVSVIIPTFNSSEFIPKAIDSALGQTYRDFEIIVVDDGSTDDTKERLTEYSGKINYNYQINGGPSSARNKGISIAKGSYIAFLDADDLWLPKKLELQVGYLDSVMDAGLVTCDAMCFRGEEIIVPSMAKERKLHSGWVLNDLLKENFLNTDNVLIRREVFNSVGLFDENRKFSEDYDLWLRIARSHKIGYVDQVLTKYRIHETNRSVRNKEDISIAHLELVFKYLNVSKFSFMKKRDILAHNYYKLGYNNFYENDLFKARKYIFLSIIHNPFRIKPYIYFFSSFLSKKLIGIIKKTKRQFSYWNKREINQ